MKEKFKEIDINYRKAPIMMYFENFTTVFSWTGLSCFSLYYHHCN